VALDEGRDCLPVRDEDIIEETVRISYNITGALDRKGTAVQRGRARRVGWHCQYGSPPSQTAGPNLDAEGLLRGNTGRVMPESGMSANSAVAGHYDQYTAANPTMASSKTLDDGGKPQEVFGRKTQSGYSLRRSTYQNAISHFVVSKLLRNPPEAQLGEQSSDHPRRSHGTPAVNVADEIDNRAPRCSPGEVVHQ
jgi:hypothetical protein